MSKPGDTGLHDLYRVLDVVDTSAHPSVSLIQSLWKEFTVATVGNGYNISDNLSLIQSFTDKYLSMEIEIQERAPLMGVVDIPTVVHMLLLKDDRVVKISQSYTYLENALHEALTKLDTLILLATRSINAKPIVQHELYNNLVALQDTFDFQRKPFEFADIEALFLKEPFIRNSHTITYTSFKYMTSPMYGRITPINQRLKVTLDKLYKQPLALGGTHAEPLCDVIVGLAESFSDINRRTALLKSLVTECLNVVRHGLKTL